MSVTLDISFNKLVTKNFRTGCPGNATSKTCHLKYVTICGDVKLCSLLSMLFANAKLPSYFVNMRIAYKDPLY
jgi:hypothetical protein